MRRACWAKRFPNATCSRHLRPARRGHHALRDAALSPMSVYLFSAVIGFLWLSTVPPTNAVIAQIFGPAHMSMLGGFVSLSHQVGSFLASGWALPLRRDRQLRRGVVAGGGAGRLRRLDQPAGSRIADSQDGARVRSGWSSQRLAPSCSGGARLPAPRRHGSAGRLRLVLRRMTAPLPLAAGSPPRARRLPRTSPAAVAQPAAGWPPRAGG